MIHIQISAVQHHHRGDLWLKLVLMEAADHVADLPDSERLPCMVEELLLLDVHLMPGDAGLGLGGGDPGFEVHDSGDVMVVCKHC